MKNFDERESFEKKLKKFKEETFASKIKKGLGKKFCKLLHPKIRKKKKKKSRAAAVATSQPRRHLHRKEGGRGRKEEEGKKRREKGLNHLKVQESTVVSLLAGDGRFNIGGTSLMLPQVRVLLCMKKNPTKTWMDKACMKSSICM